MIYNLRFKKNILIKVVLLTIYCLLLTIFIPIISYASEFYFEPSKLVTTENSKFEVRVMVDTGGQSINAVEGDLLIPENMIVTDIFYGNSLVVLWVEKPEYRGQAVHFSGITPGGFMGIIDPGSPTGFGPGELFTLVLESKDKNSKEIVIDRIQALINDGHGTSDDVSSESFVYKYGEIEIPYTRKGDNIIPDNFEPVLVKDPFFNNKYVLIFETSDGQTGISHYEVRENGHDWVVAKSPYVLENQINPKHIQVKAIDNAGNVRIAGVVDDAEIGRILDDKSVLIIMVLLVVLVLIFWKISKSRKKE